MNATHPDAIHPQGLLWRGIALAREDIVQEALRQGADPNTPWNDQSDVNLPLAYANRYGNGCAPLHGAVNPFLGRQLKRPIPGHAPTGMSRVVELLLEAGANPHITDGQGRTALMSACVLNSAAYLYGKTRKALILASISQIDKVDHSGMTALAYASSELEIDVMRALLAAGAATDVGADAGKHPLWRAMGQEMANSNHKFKKSCIELLNTHGAKWNSLDAEGYTLAMRFPETDIALCQKHQVNLGHEAPNGQTLLSVLLSRKDGGRWLLALQHMHTLISVQGLDWDVSSEKTGQSMMDAIREVSQRAGAWQGNEARLAREIMAHIQVEALSKATVVPKGVRKVARP